MITRVGVATIEIPAGAANASPWTCTFPFEVRGAVFAFNGRAGGGNASNRAGHGTSIGFWAANGQSCVFTASSDANGISAAANGLTTSCVVYLINGNKTVLSTAKVLSVVWDGTLSTVTLSMMADSTVPVTIGVQAYGGDEFGCQWVYETHANPVTVTGLPFPPQALVAAARMTLASDGAAGDSTFSLGFAAREAGDTIQQSGIGGASDHGKDTTRTGRWGSGGNLLNVFSTGITGVLKGALASWTADGFTVTYPDIVPLGHFTGLVFWGCEAAVVDAATTAGDSMRLAAPFAPVGGLAISAGDVASVSGIPPHDVRSIGLYGEGLKQLAFASADANSMATTQVSTTYRSADVYARPALDANGTLAAAMRIVGMDSAGLDLSMSVPEADAVPKWFSTLVIGPAPSASGAAPVASISAPHGRGYTVLPVGGMIQLTGTLTDAEDDPDPVGTWDSSDDTVATVSASGLVTAVAAGAALVSFGGVDSNGNPDSATHSVTVGDASTGGSFDAIRFLIQTLEGIV